MPNDLNLQLSQRVSVALVYLFIAVALAAAIHWRGYILIPGYVAVFLLLSRYWVDESRVRSRSATVFMYTVLASICWICYTQHLLALIPITLMSLMLVMIHHRYAMDPSRRWLQTVIGIVWAALAAVVISVYSLLHPFLLVLAVLALAIVILNNQFYVFLAGKRGRLFALAAIPFHLLYHFYNGISFGVGMGRFVLTSLRRLAVQRYGQR